MEGVRGAKQEKTKFKRKRTPSFPKPPPWIYLFHMGDSLRLGPNNRSPPYPFTSFSPRFLSFLPLAELALYSIKAEIWKLTFQQSFFFPRSILCKHFFRWYQPLPEVLPSFKFIPPRQHLVWNYYWFSISFQF